MPFGIALRSTSNSGWVSNSHCRLTPFRVLRYLIDGIYMADVFYGHYTAFYSPKNATAWDDILLQFNLLNKNLYDPRNGLLKHGYDASKTAVWADEKTGACPEV